jgi:hypothetical protein
MKMDSEQQAIWLLLALAIVPAATLITLLIVWIRHGMPA